MTGIKPSLPNGERGGAGTYRLIVQVRPSAPIHKWRYKGSGSIDDAANFVCAEP